MTELSKEDKNNLRRLRVEVKLHREYAALAKQKEANARGAILQMARYHYGNPNLQLYDVHECDNPFKTCLYDAGEWCIVCEEPYERK